MKKSLILNIILAAALLVVCIKFSKTEPDKTAQPDATSGATAHQSSDNAALDCILTRSSVRQYSDKAVTDAQIDTLLHAAMAAPTAMDKRPWHFVVIKDKRILTQIAETEKNMSMAEGASAGIVVCGDMSKTIEGGGRDFWIQDCSAATENLLLAAHAQGLGAVWCGIYPVEKRVEEFSKMLDLKETLIPLAFVAVGVPAGEQSSKDKWDESNVTVLK